MRKLAIFALFITLIISGCSAQGTTTKGEKVYKIGILLSDTGLGDGSFNDSAFRGLEKARDELGVLFDYKEAPDGDFEGALQELVKQDNDLIIGLGFSVQEALEKVAQEHTDQTFMLIDGASELENIVSITFKEHEGSFLVGMVAAMVSDSKKLGFIAGAEGVSVIERFHVGFEQGAKYVKPDISITRDNANNFGDADLGAKIAQEQIAEGIDFIYAAAGFTGVGALQTSQASGTFAAGVDSDQYFVAEKAVVTSMLKNIDVAVFDRIKEVVETGKMGQSMYELGIKENGVGLAPIRVKTLTPEQQKQIEDATNKIISGEITVQTP